jgi:hypothetical protein
LAEVPAVEVLDVLPAAPRVESLVAPAALVPAPGVALPVDDVLPGLAAPAPDPLADPTPLPDVPTPLLPGVPTPLLPGVPIPDELLPLPVLVAPMPVLPVEAFPVALVPALASIRPTISTR